MSATRLTYLPALDGLRAVAVVLVVAHHLDAPWMRGGFLGVDLFFVISGFLITTLLLREYETHGRISFRSFWTRRFRRLVPALVVMIAAAAAATRAYGLPEQWNSIRWDTAAALGYVANWRQMLAGQSYFESLLGPNPLQHTWSLAVEEQWYLLWPLAVALLLIVSRRWPGLARLPLILIGFGVVVSAALMAALYDGVDPTRVYCGTDTRAQQLLVGAGLAMLLARRRVDAPGHSPAWTRPLVLLCFGGFLLAATTLSDESTWLFYGGFFGFSLVAATVVWAVSSPTVTGPLAWLASPLPVWIGRRSYGIYLWHWPVIVFVGEPMGIDLPRVPLALLQVAVTLVAAELSFRFVEQPVRTSTWRPAFVIGSWASASAATVVVAAITLVPPTGTMLLTSDVVTPSTTGAVPLSSLPADTSQADPTVDTDSAAAAQTAAVPPIKRTALLLGDSTALKVLVDYDRSVARTWSIEGFARLGCSTTQGKPVDVGHDVSQVQEAQCLTWREDWAHWIETMDPGAAVVMIGAWEILDHVLEDGVHRFPNDDWMEIVRTAISDALDVAGDGGRPVLALALPCMRWGTAEPYDAQARNDQHRVDTFNALLEEVAATKPDTRVLDLPGLMCPHGEYLEEVNGEAARYDGVHVTPAGADLFVDWLVEQLDHEFPAEGAPAVSTGSDVFAPPPAG